ncbi:toll/interleukin-1 receptor domain-containing protein [Francisella salimarina]|uniref:ADP-ribosyl cyclase/cyclic ADP-ribose hydrolase n=2 Tax=Francisella salimarina TaxID=2599927 RepID=A0AAJ4NQF1_9GAMM|nr:toll/interleukin-1 receptor domain-containing protein [Francisella salimarina]
MIINIKSKKTYLQKKESTKKCELLNLKKKLRKEEDSLRKKIQQAEKKEQEKQLNFQRKLQTEINQVKQIKLSEDNQSLLSAEYDLFISHASEDKEDFVRPLAEALKNLGVRIWYDELTLKVGDSLREKIDQGLIKSKFGTIVLSSSFISKSWTKYELNSMVAKEMNGHKMILPIWHKVTKTDIINFSPALADKVALNTSINSIDEIAKELANVIQPT